MLSLVKKSETPFFLTGGTALSRYYFHHRFSEDLDLFVNDDPCFSMYVKTILSLLKDRDLQPHLTIDLKDITLGDTYTRLVIHDKNNPEIELQIDMINDIAPQYGNFEYDSILGKIDNWRNILSNKLTALFRSEPKDVADIWIIAKNKKFQWKDIVMEAKSKEVGVEPETLYDILKSFPIKDIDFIKWIQKPDKEKMKSDLGIISDDILFARENSLCALNPKN